jgi:hypothetical protein
VPYCCNHLDAAGARIPFVVAAVLAVAIGFVRHDPVRTIVLNATGYPLFRIGLGVAAEMSVPAFWAATAASLGIPPLHDGRP